ncbi:GntR family transcriptional regulator [Streptomyces sp. NPDC093108]|uniref:GntR family transcriptional regulator n=1 Tax=Streptomyces sp. NPDC093108 TaxID=3366030 RepID=UPI00380EF24D
MNAENETDDSTGLLTFERIAEDLRGQIRSGKLKPGRLLPSQAKLMKTYRASSLTVQKATRLLRDEGLVVSRQGRGTFAAAPGQAREPGTLSQPAKLPADLADTTQELNDVVLRMDQTVKDLTIRISSLEARHRTRDAKKPARPAASSPERGNRRAG